MQKIALFHGYELTGSGSNEYTRYLARALAETGQEVHVICREPNPAGVAGVSAAVAWHADGGHEVLFGTPGGVGSITLHQLPHASVRPVYVTDKRREGNVKAFTDITDAELDEVRQVAAESLRRVLTAYPVDILHANHTVLQPTIAADVCPSLGIPFVIYPHGSDIEYTIRHDERYRLLAGEALAAASGVITGSREMLTRLVDLYPELTDDLRSKWSLVGVGVDVSRFVPIAHDQRRAAIEALVATDPGGGRTPAESAELRRRLAAQGVVALDSTPHFAPEVPDDDLVPRLLAVDWERDQVLIFVGALTVGKGVQGLISALPYVLRQAPDTQLFIVGSGRYRDVLEALVYAISTGDEALLDELVAHGNDLDQGPSQGAWGDVAAYLADPDQRQILLNAGSDFARHVHFTGRLDHSRLNLLFGCADLAVFPSVLPEAYPLVLMESLASGVLPCASDLTGLGEGLGDLEPELGATLVDRLRLPTEPKVRVARMGEQLAALLVDPQLHGQTDALRGIAVERYDWDVRAQQMLTAYQEALVRQTEGACRTVRRRSKARRRNKKAGISVPVAIALVLGRYDRREPR